MARGSVLSGLRRALTVRIASPHPACSLRGWSIPCPKAAQLPRGCLHLPPRPLPPHLPPLEVGRPLSPDPFVLPAAHQAGGAHSPGRGGNPFPGRGALVSDSRSCGGLTLPHSPRPAAQQALTRQVSPSALTPGPASSPAAGSGRRRSPVPLSSLRAAPGLPARGKHQSRRSPLTYDLRRESRAVGRPSSQPSLGPRVGRQAPRAPYRYRGAQPARALTPPRPSLTSLVGHHTSLFSAPPRPTPYL